MNVLIVYAHPEPASFNAAMCARARDALMQAGHEVVVGKTSGPATAHAARHGGSAPGIIRKQQRVADVDLVILQFPLGRRRAGDELERYVSLRQGRSIGELHLPSPSIGFRGARASDSDRMRSLRETKVLGFGWWA